MKRLCLRLRSFVSDTLTISALRSCKTLLCLTLLTPLMCACAVGSRQHDDSLESQSVTMSVNKPWYLAELDNSATLLTAPKVATNVLQTHLRMRDVNAKLQPIDAAPANDGYSIEGEVLEWHYEHGAASRPVISLRLDVRDLSSKRVLRSDTISERGSRGQSISQLADELLADYTQALALTEDQPRQAVAGQLAGTPAGHYTESVGSLAGLSSAPLGIRRSATTRESATLFNGVKGLPSLAGRSVAFYYGATPPIDELSQFDRLVLEPDNIVEQQLVQLTAHGTQAYAYLSVGEVGKHREYADALDPSWILGSNPVWDSQVLDLSNVQLREFLVSRVGELVRRGYHGLFLDTMDSFHIVAGTASQKRAQQAGLVSLISAFARTYPQLKIITNRGFEVLDEIATHVDAVVAESLYSSWNNELQRYVPVSEQDRQWLLSKLIHVDKKLGLDVIVLDYVAPAERDTAREVAERIARHGYIPWVANPELDFLGVGALEVMPRKVLLLYDGALEELMKDSEVHRYAAMPIEYLGYVPEYLDVSLQPLPQDILKGRYAGIVTWASEPFAIASFRPWLTRQMQEGVAVAFLGTPPVTVDGEIAQLMGVSSGALPDADSATAVHSDDMIKPERTLPQRVGAFDLALTNQSADNRVHMQYRDARDVSADVVLTGTFGGYALTPGVVMNALDYGVYWVVDPFRFLETALQLPRIPQPDVTSENGRRLWLAHIDGDALPSWAQMPGRRLGAEVLYDEILTQYPLPHTVSVVEGEMTGFAAFADRRARMFKIAQRIFELDNVEIASHTYSHPFQWLELGKFPSSGKFNLAIRDYRYNAEREVAGSINFINRQLAPADKRAQVMLWSGDALPHEEDLAIASRLGLDNMNGGYTAITPEQPTMTLVSSMARPVGKQLQVYAPIMNENVYTNDWQGPFDGFRRVVETFKLTENPRRLKPINVYYHFYSGTKVSALRALREVYDWSTEQDIFPTYVSDYARKVPDFRRAGVGRYLDGRWKMSALGNIRSLRLLGDRRYPVLASSRGISGARALHDGVYIHTDGSDTVSFSASDTLNKLPHLVSSNGRVHYWRLTAKGLEFHISGAVPVSVELGGNVSTGCVLQSAEGSIAGARQVSGTLRFTFTQQDTGDVTLNCPA